ncbi:MAG TPA: hypothetical protein VNS81_04275 [Nocardioides sp.]|nr:hypothetical protein [Nocardioides sp.]
MLPNLLRIAAVRRLGIAGAGGLLLVGGALAANGDVAADTAAPSVPVADCGPGSMPETSIQGRVPKADYDSGRAAQGYTCNTVQVGHHGSTGGFKTLRYTDSQGHTCAFYDSSRMIGLDVATNLLNGTGLGVVVLDMTDPAHPVKTANLVTPAMLQPHESLLVNQQRGLLAAVMGTLVTAPGILDVYDVKTDCRHPRLQSSTLSGVLGHESGFSPDGRTFWSVGSAGFTLTAVDLTDPRRPRTLLTKSGMVYHGVRLSPDGRTMYAADMGMPSSRTILDNPGLAILDVSEVQDRKPKPTVRVLSHMTWSGISIPQVPQPFTRDGHRYLFEVDEFSDWFGDGYKIDFAHGSVGAARIINVDDPARPFLVSDVRLQVHEPKNRTPELLADPGAKNVIGGYAAHYCSVASEQDPSLAACSMNGSGLRVFDIRDVAHPREAAYFNKPAKGGANALSQPAWDPQHDSVWYTDGTSGFFAVRLTNGVGDLLD